MGNSINSFIYLKENNINETKPLVYPVINDNSIKHIYGWKRDIPDHRDIYYNKNITNMDFSKIVDLRNKCPDIYNQGNLGSCTANALAFLFEFDEILKNKENEFNQINNYEK